jgi:hypothetical protein
VIVVLLPGTGPVELTVTTCRSGQPFLLLHGGAGPHPVTGSGELLATAHLPPGRGDHIAEAIVRVD